MLNTGHISVVSSTMSSAINALSSVSHMPCIVHLLNRVYTLFHGPNRSGKSAHGIPVFSDARTIRELLDNHNIDIADKRDKFHMLTVKSKRNALAHGEESFSDCAREITISQLKEIKDEVLSFIGEVIICMTTYYDTQLYRDRK